MARASHTQVVAITYVGGPTAVLDLAGIRCLTDPTFDPAGTDYVTPVYTLHKTQSPAVAAADLGPIDAVLLSHDHHFDNLDRAGRAFVDRAPLTLTTRAGAGRLGGAAVGLDAWETHDLRGRDGVVVRVTATPARHGPAGGDRGPVIGFVLESAGGTVYVTGDTVWYDGVAEVARRFSPDVVVLFAGAARVAAVGPDALTCTTDDAIAVARAFADAAIVPLHVDGWTHFSESRVDLARAFAAAGLGARLHWPAPGTPLVIDAVHQ